MKLVMSFLIVFLFLASCSLSPGNIQSRQSTDLAARHIKRIAVLAPTAPAAAAPAKNPLLGVPSDKRVERQDPGEILMRLVYSAMVALPRWQIISESELKDVSDSVPQTSDMARLRKVGELVYADAVMTGRILRYRERVGGDIGVQSPASVAFTLELIDVQRGDVIWSTRFDETQKGLSENILSLGDIRERGLRWLTAEQLAQDGVRKIIHQLHQTIVKPTS
jgi:PBP1b-binding outer membrane lipoprotein LpoB